MNNIKESNDMKELLIAIDKLKKAFIASYLAAPMRREFVFGQNVPGKRDVQREFVMNLKALISVYTMKIPTADSGKESNISELLDVLDKMDSGSGNELEDEVNDE